MSYTNGDDTALDAEIDGALAKYECRPREVPDGVDEKAWLSGFDAAPRRGVDHPTNRIGDKVIDHVNGSIYKHCREGKPDKYFAWATGSGRAGVFGCLEDAANYLEIHRPVGCSDYEGQVRLGKKIDGNDLGEIRKHVSEEGRVEYFVWLKGLGYAMRFTRLSQAREALGGK